MCLWMCVSCDVHPSSLCLSVCLSVQFGDFNDYDDKDPLTRDMRHVQRAGRFFQHPNPCPDPALNPGKPDTPYMDSERAKAVTTAAGGKELDAEDEREYYQLSSAGGGVAVFCGARGQHDTGRVRGG